MAHKIHLDFVTITQRLKQLKLPEVDQVVGIAKGGVVPASLVAFQLERPLSLLHISYRDEDNAPLHESPVLQSPGLLPLDEGDMPQRILLVDDVCVSGQTLQLAKQILHQHHIFTLVMKGDADYQLFPEIDTCVHWPWR
ncbi:MAG: phosphoribosyltransferase [Chloroflexi bacterium]|nr:phosphoribosyltransferase [Chloroflexota bacterium]